MRATWDEYFMEIAEIVKTRSTCLRRQVGAVIVRDNRIITTGYNGSPTGTYHCSDKGTCPRIEMNIPSGERHELCRALHAEQNAIIQAANMGVSTDNSTLYVTTQPCVICAKMCINAGIKKIVYKGPYPDKLSIEMLNEAKVELIVVE
ncbi:MAG: deoxycytidylate deaminase [Anaerotignaceae bacterium]